MSAPVDNRKRKHSRWNPVKQKCVEPGISGLFFTCDGHEKQALNEAYNLIDEAVDAGGVLLASIEPTSTESSAAADKNDAGSDEDSDEDISVALKRECKELRETAAGNGRVRRCKQRPTGVKNCLFVFVKDAKVVELAEKLIELTQASPRCRFLQRVLPVEFICELDLKKINDNIFNAVAKYLKPKSDGTHPSYALDFKARNNNSVKRDMILEMLNNAVVAIAPKARVNLTGADILFYVQIVRTSVMVSGIRNYFALRKYSMRPTQPVSGESKDKKETDVVEENIDKKETDVEENKDPVEAKPQGKDTNEASEQGVEATKDDE